MTIPSFGDAEVLRAEDVPATDIALIWEAPADWEDSWGGWHTEFARVELGEGELAAEGAQLGIDPEYYRLEYRLDAGGERFATRRLEVSAVGEGWRRRLLLERDPRGRWSLDAEGEGATSLQPPGGDADALAGALDCDLGFSPLTNTMPVLRHALHREPGAVELVTAWVSVPDLSVHRAIQRYSHIDVSEDRARVRFESLEGGEVVFARVLELDPEGLVDHYPGLARRID